MRMNMTGLAGALALCALTTSASAATMTFSDFGPEMIGADTYTEDGITVTGNSGLGDYGPGHIDAQNSPAPSMMTFTMKGIFDANWKGQALEQPTQVSTGFHPAPTAYYSKAEYLRLDAFFTYIDQFLASKTAGPVVYIRMSDAVKVW